MLNEGSNQKEMASVREATPLLAELPAQNATGLTQANFNDPDFKLLDYRLNTNLAFAQIDENGFEEHEKDENDLSLIGRGLLMLTNGRHDSFASLIGAGVRKAQQDLSDAATDAALAAYQRAEERFEETRERWEDKRGE